MQRLYLEVFSAVGTHTDDDLRYLDVTISRRMNLSIDHGSYAGWFKRRTGYSGRNKLFFCDADFVVSKYKISKAYVFIASD